MLQQIDVPEGFGAGTPTSSSFTVGVYEEASTDYLARFSASETVWEHSEKFFFLFSRTTTRTKLAANRSVWNAWGGIWTFPRAEPLHFHFAFTEPLDPELFRSWREALERDTLRLESSLEKEAFIRQKPKLLLESKYRGKFVAIVDGKPVDSDSNDQLLAGRILTKYGYRPSYIGYVGELKPELYIPPS